MACPANYVARSNGLSCKPVQCSHMTCQHEAHSCNYGKSSATLRAYIGQYRHVTSNCDGIGSGGHQSIRVSHGGNLCDRPKCTEEELKMNEVPCANGHRCGMGVVT